MNPTTENFKEEAAAGMETIKASAQHAAGSAKETIRHTTEEVKAKASEVAGEVKGRSQRFFDNQKSQVADRVTHCSAAARHAADKLKEEHDPNIAEYADALADRLDRASNYVRERDWQGLMSDAEDATRQHPEVVLGGMFAVGLAMGRFLKASRAPRRMVPDEAAEYGREMAQETGALPGGS